MLADSIVAALGPNAIPVDATTSLYPARPDLSAAGSGHPYEMRRITSTRLDPGINKLNGRVADAFGALQTRVKQDVGYDFLGVLAEMARVMSLVTAVFILAPGIIVATGGIYHPLHLRGALPTPHDGNAPAAAFRTTG